MNGWILLVYDQGAAREWAAWGVLDAAPFAPDPEQPGVAVLPRTAVATPDPYAPSVCWAFATADDAQAAIGWLEAKGYRVRSVYCEGLVVHGV